MVGRLWVNSTGSSGAYRKPLLGPSKRYGPSKTLSFLDRAISVFGDLKLHHLRRLDILCRDFLRRVLYLPKDTPIAALHAPITEGGLGISNFEEVIPARWRGFLKRMANSPDEVIRILASAKLAALRNPVLKDCKVELHTSCDGIGLSEARHGVKPKWVDSGNQVMKGRTYINAMGELLHVAVCGHSYVPRIVSPDHGIPSRVRGANAYLNVEIFYKGGATIQSFGSDQAYTRLREYSPDMTFVLLGGNDIRPDVPPRAIVEQMEAMTLRIRNDTGGMVRWSQIEDRTVVRGNMTPHQYHQINKGIRRVCGKSPIMRDRVFRLPYNTSELEDGVHPDQSGILRLSDSLEQIINDTAIYYLRGRNSPDFRW